MATDPPTYTTDRETPAVTIDTKKPIRTKGPGFDRFLALTSIVLQIGLLVALAFIAAKIQGLHKALLGSESSGEYIRRPLINVNSVLKTQTVTIPGTQTVSGLVSVTGTPTVSIYTRR